MYALLELNEYFEEFGDHLYAEVLVMWRRVYGFHNSKVGDEESWIYQVWEAS
jgi:hypothetical protein